jgi:integrase
MPAIHAKYKCTQGEVFAYATDPTKWYLRIYIKEQRKYKYRLIKGATNAIEAMQHVGDVTIDKTTDKPIVVLIRSYIQHEQQRYSINQLAENTIKRKLAFIKRLEEYCSKRNIHTLTDIRRSSFDQWALHFMIRSKLSLAQDHKQIKHWLNYLVHNEYIETDPVILPKVIVGDEDLAANPPIPEHDWQLILRYINRWEKDAIGRPNYRHHWWRYIFRHFIHIAKRSGLRPHELCALRWCDVEIIDNPHSIQEDSIATLTVRRSKTHSMRRVPTVMGRELRRLRQWQETELAARNKPSILKDGLIFRDINGKGYDVPAFSKCWRDHIMTPLKGELEGDKDYGRNYTVYSLRSSYINDQLKQGVDIFLLTKACGHSVKTLMRYYERFDVTQREAELAHLPIGEKKPKQVSRSTL